MVYLPCYDFKISSLRQCSPVTGVCRFHNP